MPCLRANSVARCGSRAATATTWAPPIAPGRLDQGDRGDAGRPQDPDPQHGAVIRACAPGGVEGRAPRTFPRDGTRGAASRGGRVGRDMSTDANAPARRPTVGHIRRLDGIGAGGRAAEQVAVDDGRTGWRAPAASATIDPPWFANLPCPSSGAPRSTTSTPWRPSWPRPSSTTRSRATSSATRRAARPACARTSAPRCAPTTCPSGAATRPTVSPGRPSGPRRASRSSPGSGRSSPCCRCCPTWPPTSPRRCAS